MAAVKKNVQTIAEKDGSPFESVSQALSALTTEERSLSLIYLVQNGSTVDRYFFKDGLEDADFVLWETEGGGSYLSYQALFTSNGASAPTVTVLNEDDSNYLGDITWSVGGTGYLYGEKTGAFTANLTVSPQHQTQCYNLADDAMYVLAVFRQTSDQVRVFTGDATVTPTNSLLTSKFIEIRVYQ